MAVDWLAPAVGFVILEGALGITTKLALRGIAWRQLILWTATAYVALGAFLTLFVGESLPLSAGAGWAIASGLLAAIGLITFFVALERGEASRVVPITAAYPLVTAVLAVLVLAEEVSPTRAIGTALVVAGIVWLGSE